MTRISRIPVALALVATLCSVPAFAGVPKRRSVTPPTNTLSDVTVKGTVLDDVTGKPIRNVEVTSGTAKTITDAAGRFQLVFKSGSAVQIRIARSGYAAKDVSVTPGSDTTFRLTPTATVRVKMTGGTEYAIDTESVQFAFASPMSGYPSSENPRWCRNGQDYQPERATISKIVGPATQVTDSACCERGPVLRVAVTLKSGEAVDARFADSCFGYEPIFVGRDHTTGDFVYLRFTEISEVVFP